MVRATDVLLSTSAVAELVGASVRQVDYWERTGLLKASGKPAAGKGSRRRYTFRDVVAYMTIARLRERGCPLQKIRTAVRHLQKHYPGESGAARLARLTLLTDGKHVYMLSDERKVMEVVTKQHVWAVPLGLVIQEAQQRVRSLPSEWTEPVKVDGETYHLNIVRDGETGTYTVQCRELPAAIEEGDTVKETIANGKAAIQSVKSFMAKRGGARRKRVPAG